MIDIHITTEDFNIQTQLAKVRGDGHTGAVVSFIGLVRDMLDTDLEYLYLECYPKMAKKLLTDIAKVAMGRWRVRDIVIYHRIGKLTPQDQIVLVIATSRHREDAFKACWFMMDHLKTEAPFWKKEYTTNGEHWVATTYKDLQAKQCW